MFRYASWKHVRATPLTSCCNCLRRPMEEKLKLDVIGLRIIEAMKLHGRLSKQTPA